MNIQYQGKKYGISTLAGLHALLQGMATDVTKIGADTQVSVQRLDEHQAAIMGGGGGANLLTLAALSKPGTLALNPAPSTGPASPGQLNETDAPTLGTQIILDAQSTPPTVEALAAAASLGTSGSITMGTANTAQKMSDTAHALAVTLGSGATNGTVGYLTTVKSGKPYPSGRIPVVNVGQNKLGLRTLQSAIIQDAQGYIHYPLYIPGVLVTGTDEIPVTMIA